MKELASPFCHRSCFLLLVPCSCRGITGRSLVYGPDSLPSIYQQAGTCGPNGINGEKSSEAFWFWDSCTASEVNVSLLEEERISPKGSTCVVRDV